jgi:hypothetical protein
MLLPAPSCFKRSWASHFGALCCVVSYAMSGSRAVQAAYYKLCDICVSSVASLLFSSIKSIIFSSDSPARLLVLQTAYLSCNTVLFLLLFIQRAAALQERRRNASAALVGASAVAAYLHSAQPARSEAGPTAAPGSTATTSAAAAALLSVGMGNLDGKSSSSSSGTPPRPAAGSNSANPCDVFNSPRWRVSWKSRRQECNALARCVFVGRSVMFLLTAQL